MAENTVRVSPLQPRILEKIALAALAWMACSCGSTSGILGSNSYPGTWSGTITTNPASGSGTSTQSGSLSIVIDTSDNVTGTDTITVNGTTTTDSGTISSSGDLLLSTYRAGATTALGTINATLTVIDNTLTGSGTLTENGISTPVTISLNLTSSATAKLRASTQPSRG